MSNDRTFGALCLATASEQDELSQPFEVLRAGDYRKRDLEVTTADLDAMVANFNRGVADGHELPVDLDHSFAEGGTSRAVGWFKVLVRKGESLFARVKWTPEAQKEIGDGHFRYFSAEFHTDWEDEHGKKWGPTLLAGTLTNRPFVRGMTPVALSDSAREALTEGVAATVESLELAPPESWSERPAVADKPDKKDKDTGPVTLAEGRALELKVGDETVQLSEDRIRELVESDTSRGSETSTLKEQVTTLAARVENSENALLAEQLQADLGQARREGRIDAKAETSERWKERYADMGREKARALLFEFPAETIAMSERGHGDDKPTVGDDAPEGVHAERHALNERATALAEEKDIDYADAVKLAATELGVTL